MRQSRGIYLCKERKIVYQCTVFVVHRYLVLLGLEHSIKYYGESVIWVRLLRLSFFKEVP